MGLDAAAIIAFLKDFLLKWVFKANIMTGTAMVSIGSMLVNCIGDPEGAINTGMNHVVDMSIGHLPSTPPDMQYWTLIGHIAEKAPALGWASINSMFSGTAGLLSVFLGTKVVKAVMPIGK